MWYKYRAFLAQIETKSGAFFAWNMVIGVLGIFRSIPGVFLGHFLPNIRPKCVWYKKGLKAGKKCPLYAPKMGCKMLIKYAGNGLWNVQKLCPKWAFIYLKNSAGNAKGEEVLLRIHAVLSGIPLSGKLSYDSAMGQQESSHISAFLQTYCPTVL